MMGLLLLLLISTTNCALNQLRRFNFPAGKYKLKVNNNDPSIVLEIHSLITTKARGKRNWHHYDLPTIEKL